MSFICADDKGSHRKVLDQYSFDLLDQMSDCHHSNHHQLFAVYFYVRQNRSSHVDHTARYLRDVPLSLSDSHREKAGSGPGAPGGRSHPGHRDPLCHLRHRNFGIL